MITFIENNTYDTQRKTLIEAHISDIHFGSMDPKYQYTILKEQFIDPLKELPVLDIVSINGDIFHHKVMGNSDILMYALKFFNDLITEVIGPKQTTLLIIEGTDSHDAKQLKLFYQYADPTIDVRVIQNIQFEYVKGAKILCIPDLAGIDNDTYEKFLFYSGNYDAVFMHGTIKGAVPKDMVNNTRLFIIEDFINCMGPIISGHVHTGGCFNTYFYYCGSPYTWRFGEEVDKGFLIVLHNLNTHDHFVRKEVIKSYRYISMNLDHILDNDPKDIISYINNIKEKEDIDYIRVIFDREVQSDKKTIIDSFYRNNKNVKFKYNFTREQKMIEKALTEMEDMSQFSYLYDKSLSEYDKFARYINEDLGEMFVTAKQIEEILKEDI